MRGALRRDNIVEFYQAVSVSHVLASANTVPKLSLRQPLRRMFWYALMRLLLDGGPTVPKLLLSRQHLRCLLSFCAHSLVTLAVLFHQQTSPAAARVVRGHSG